jgi:hypothetical protein
MVISSIQYSGLLITRTLHRHKHQLRDFFNRHRRWHKHGRLFAFSGDSERYGDVSPIDDVTDEVRYLREAAERKIARFLNITFSILNEQ